MTAMHCRFAVNHPNKSGASAKILPQGPIVDFETQIDSGHVQIRRVNQHQHPAEQAPFHHPLSCHTEPGAAISATMSEVEIMPIGTASGCFGSTTSRR